MPQLLTRTFFFVLLSAQVYAIDVPQITGPVVDPSRRLSARDLHNVTRAVESLNASGKVQMAILIVDSLQGEEIESYGIAVAEKWKLGTKKGDNGLIFIVAPPLRRMRLEVGHGLEGDISDIVSKRILDQIAAPYFRKQLLAAGLIAVTQAIGERLQVSGTNAGEPDTVQSPPPSKQSGAGGFLILLFVFALAILLVWIDAIRGGGWGGGGWSGGGGGWSGGGGGGGFSGGGGSFGGGGSSSSW